MAKKLPAIYRSGGTKNQVNKEVFYSFLEEKNEIQEKKSEEPKKESTTVSETLDRIFNQRGYSFNVPVQIELKDQTIDTFLAMRTSNMIYTLDDQKIPIESILSIQIKKP